MDGVYAPEIDKCRVAYMDVGQGRKQDAVALQILVIVPLLPAIRALHLSILAKDGLISREHMDVRSDSGTYPLTQN